MSAAALKAVKALAPGRLRVSIHAEDPETAAELRRLLEEAGHEVVEAAGFAPAGPEPPALPTPREVEGPNAIRAGPTNKTIARRLGNSLHHVEVHAEPNLM